jgi:hypothetical protein
VTGEEEEEEKTSKAASNSNELKQILNFQGNTTWKKKEYLSCIIKRLISSLD